MIIIQPVFRFLGVIFDGDHDFEGPRSPRAHLDTVLRNLSSHLGHPRNSQRSRSHRLVTDAATQSAVLLLVPALPLVSGARRPHATMRAGRTAPVELLHMRCCGSVDAGLRTQCAEAQKSSVLRPTRAPRGGCGMRRRRGEGWGGEGRSHFGRRFRRASPPLLRRRG